MSKPVNQLAVGDTVVSITNVDGTVATFTSPMTVVAKTGAVLKLDAPHLRLIRLPSGNSPLAFWPTGAGDPRTCEMAGLSL